MLVWINGAFGAGKTQTAFELQRRLDGAHVADPELIGYGIHRMLPKHARADFQDRPQWRSAVVATLADAAEATDGPVLVPMTLVDPAYFDEIMGGLAACDVDVRHVTLSATPDTLRRRLGTRSAAWLGRDESWAVQQIDRCATALVGSRFAEHIPTDDHTIDEVVEDIADRTGLTLVRPRLRALPYQLRRISVGIKHIHF